MRARDPVAAAGAVRQGARTVGRPGESVELTPSVSVAQGGRAGAVLICVVGMLFSRVGRYSHGAER